MEKVLEIKNISKAYNTDKPAVKDVSFSMGNGEIVAIFGESGCGKSSLLQMISGYLEPDSGRVFINGNKLPYPSEILMPGDPDIEIVRQDYDLFPNHKIEEVLDYKLRKYPDNFIKERIEELLKVCGLEEYRNRIIKNLSGGQQQRVAIAQALANEPDVLLMDEPFNSLDGNRKRALRKLIRSIVDTYQVSVVLVTHDAEDVFQLADQLIVMNKGVFVQKGDPMSIYQKPQDSYVAELLGELNYLDNKTGVRPEDIKIRKNKSGESRIDIVDFNGGYYRYEVIQADKRWVVYDTVSWNQGLQVDLTIDSNKKVLIVE
jgi:ABC-type Fe3+/spermidine/putrescine transport system ATPase subunit